MRGSKKAMLAAGLLAAAAAMTGCTADTRMVASPTPQAVQQQTAQPDTEETQAPPETSMEAEETPEPLALQVDGKTLETGVLRENGKLLLPLEATGEALGWKADSTKQEAETQTSHEIVLQKDDSRITVSYQVSDNTIRQISWQKDGLLVPVDTRLEIEDGTVYVPAAFFEEAMGAKVSEKQGMVEVSSPEPMDTPQTNQ